MGAMFQCHDLVLLGPSRCRKRTIACVEPHDQGVIPPDAQGVGQAVQNMGSFMAHFTYLAMHRTHGPCNTPPKYLTDTLVPQANTENWHKTRIFRTKMHLYSRLIWRTGAGRNDYGFRYFLRELGIIAHDFRRFAQFPEIICDRVDKGIIIVDDENHEANSLAPKAAKIDLALSKVSSYSAAGSDAVTIPPPACTTQLPLRKLAVLMTIFVSIVPSKLM